MNLKDYERLLTKKPELQQHHPRKPSILIGVPISIEKEYCFDEFLESITDFTYPNFDTLFVDNSPNNDFSKKLRKTGAFVVQVRPKAKRFQEVLAESQETIRQFALSRKYDYLLHLESDIIAPNTIIEDLMAAKKPVVGALYHLGNGAGSELLFQVPEVLQLNDGLVSIADSNKSTLFELDGRIKPAAANIGCGCVLIYRKVLEGFKFRSDKNLIHFPDTFFAQDLARMGVKIYTDTSMILKHLNRPKRKELIA